jgi:hypothetical protein
MYKSRVDAQPVSRESHMGGREWLPRGGSGDAVESGYPVAEATTRSRVATLWRKPQPPARPRPRLPVAAASTRSRVAPCDTLHAAKNQRPETAAAAPSSEATSRVRRILHFWPTLCATALPWPPAPRQRSTRPASHPTRTPARIGATRRAQGACARSAGTSHRTRRRKSAC